MSLITPLLAYARIRDLLPTLLHPPGSVDPVQPEPQPPPAAVPAHRLRAATWMNGRTALGAGFVLLAVLAGALFLDRAQRLVPVYAAARDLPAGTPLRSGDLMVVRVRLPDSSLRHYLRPGPDRAVAGRVLTAPVRRETLVPAELVLASSQQADLVELPVQADPGDMAQGLRPGDNVQVLAAYTDGARRGRAVVLLPTAEVVRVLEDPAGLTGTARSEASSCACPATGPRRWPRPSPPPGSSWSRPPAQPPTRPLPHRRPRAGPWAHPTPPSPTSRDPAPPSPTSTRWTPLPPIPPTPRPTRPRPRSRW